MEYFPSVKLSDCLVVNGKDQGDRAPSFKQHVFDKRREERTLVNVPSFTGVKILIASQCLIHKLLCSNFIDFIQEFKLLVRKLRLTSLTLYSHLMHELE